MFPCYTKLQAAFIYVPCCFPHQLVDMRDLRNMFAVALYFCHDC